VSHLVLPRNHNTSLAKVFSDSRLLLAPPSQLPHCTFPTTHSATRFTSGKTQSGAPVCRFRGGSLGFRTRKKEMARLHRHPARTFPPHLTYRLAAGPIQASLKNATPAIRNPHPSQPYKCTNAPPAAAFLTRLTVRPTKQQSKQTPPRPRQPCSRNLGFKFHCFRLWWQKAGSNAPISIRRRVVMHTSGRVENEHDLI
jgi:hypothetical protein